MDGGKGLRERQGEISWISMSQGPSLLSINALLSKLENLKPILHVPFGVSVIGPQPLH